MYERAYERARRERGDVDGVMAILSEGTFITGLNYVGNPAKLTGIS
jgi:hypothetical protein